MDIVETLILRAVADFGADRRGAVFNSAGFGVQVKAEFGLDAAPDGRWAAGVLSKLPYVTQLSGGCHWAYRPPASASPRGPSASKLSEPYDWRE